MKKELLGVIDATTYHEDLEDLLAHRSLAALPFAGRYRIIDFVSIKHGEFGNSKCGNFSENAVPFTNGSSRFREKLGFKS